MFTVGSTIRINIEYCNFENILEDPFEPKILIYNYKRELIDEIFLGENHKISLGKYNYDYTIPESSYNKLYIETSGYIDGKIKISRIILDLNFANKY